MIELSDVIRELRSELQEASAEAPQEGLRFELGPIELEVTVALVREGGASAKVKFYVVELGADGKLAQTSTQRIKLTLKPRQTGSEGPPLVSGTAVHGED
ncbi:trypco2 family protein [Actinoplanes sp. NPDC051851]|uniref:trypco2 family protein n=1 Tax=Actinoplanes sp. NPDC051851 TaxID=3154753 RepID=UPI0034205DE0